MSEIVDDFNKRIRKTAGNMWGDRGGTSLEWRRKLKDSSTYRTTKEQATSLLSLLVKQYGLDPKRQFFGTQEPKERERGGPSTN